MKTPTADRLIEQQLNEEWDDRSYTFKRKADAETFADSVSDLDWDNISVSRSGDRLVVVTFQEQPKQKTMSSIKKYLNAYHGTPTTALDA